MYNIDHFMLAGNNLDSLSQYFTDLTGIPVASGGVHPDLGTHNKLVATSSDLYLELIAPNPTSDTRTGLRNVLEQMAQPHLHRFIVQSQAHHFPGILSAYQRVGVAAEVKHLSRQTASGETLRWQLLMPAAVNEYGIFAPLFIDWGTATHPARTLPSAPCSVVACSAGHPEPERLQALWDEIGFKMPLATAVDPYFTVTLDTPKGLVDLRA
ncbi:VOC family protein [Pusillimonas sp. ANT_WB101]|uniref:VOC family protein n=1 Tax=Pusillimonas sp. ANT_WB101 TaxID=2597356 RepID=UPI0011ECF4D9|nr:VOC family protein [Pusillimonas sp. ANT_WB101]KAA0890836.1 VOC family protein [Pusillimonas sp. ANT_WB101]